jgi:TRAP-type C4-dicarboxylate transport system permease small subunit
MFLTVSLTLKREGHVKMDLVLTRLRPGTQSILNIITSVIGIFICLVLTWYGTVVTWDYFQTGYYIGTMLMPPKAPIMLIIPVGSFLLLIQFLRRAYSYLESWRAS